MTEMVLTTLPRALDDVVSATGGRLTRGSSREFRGVSIDSRTLAPGQLFFAIAGPRFDGHDFVADVAGKAAGAVVHRNVAAPPGLPVIEVADTTLALAALARATRAHAALPVVAITGSVGKTTTKEMTAALLELRGPVLRSEGNLNNQYGLPLTLLRLEERHSAAVLELGMSAAGELRALSRIAAPDVAVITRVAPVHLEYFASVEAIADAKFEVLEGLAGDGVAVLNGDDPLSRARGERHRGRVVWFGRDRRHDVSAENWRGNAFGMRFDLVVDGRKHDVALPLAGAHFVESFLAATSAAWVLGVPMESVAAAAAGLEAVRHRGELLRLREEIVVLDDCYNSNPVALEAAVAALQLLGGRRRVAVLGDMLELGPTARALHQAAGRGLSGRVDLLVGIGALAAGLVEGARPHVEAVHFADAGSASAALPELLRQGDAVLVKGSRGIHLEQVVEALLLRFGRHEG